MTPSGDLPARASVRYGAALLSALLAAAIVGPAGAIAAEQDAADLDPAAGPASTAEGSFTPLLVQQGQAPVPVRGSDGRYHLLWELPIQNAVSLELTLAEVEVLGDGEPIVTLRGDDLASAMEILGTQAPGPTVGPGQAAFVFLTAAFDDVNSIPSELEHRVVVEGDRLPGPMTSRGGTLRVAKDAVVPVLSPPLAGERYLVGDGCCASLLHIRSVLPLDNNTWFAQRFAIDWEQLDEEGRFSTGDPTVPESYAIYGNDVLAAAGGTVVTAIDGFGDEVPGTPPVDISPTEADGNAVVVDIGDGLYTLYAHLEPGSVMVKVGDRVERGQVIGRVGNTGNSLVPHLHFHVMDSPSPLASNGRPYVIDGFEVMGSATSTEAWVAAETTGEVLDWLPAADPSSHQDELPLDIQLVNFR